MSIAAAAERNKLPIIQTLRLFLPSPPARILEVASGTGQHVAYFASELSPRYEFQPTELDDSSFPSINEHSFNHSNILPPALLDASQKTWVGFDDLPTDSRKLYDAIININMIHISPWESCVGLMAGAARNLREKGILFLYGPYLIEGQPTTESNADFDRSLRLRNDKWGLRDAGAVKQLAKSFGFSCVDMVAMPSNNFSIIFEKSSEKLVGVVRYN